VLVLIGAENPYYSITALDVRNKPLIVFCQTVYSNPDRQRLSGQVDMHRWNLEQQIHASTRYFGCGARMHRDLVLKNNPEAIVFKIRFPEIRPRLIVDIKKDHDFVFFAAGVTKKKGIEDAILALSQVKMKFPRVTLDVVGKCAADYKAHLLDMITKLDLDGNIEFHEYFPQQSDMHAHIQHAKYALLPVKLDAIPGTIRESLMLDLPVVTYRTTGTPHLNKYGEAVLLCEIDDIDALAKNMIRVMTESALEQNMLKNARKYVDIEFDNKRNTDRLVSMFYTVYDHYHGRSDIPEDLVFDLDEFPEY